MFINSRGDIFHGVAGGNASINNVPFSAGAAGGWVTDDECCYANGDKAWITYLYNQASQQRRPAVDDPAAEQYGQGFNIAFAGAGIWVAWLGAKDSHKGVYSSSGFRLTEGGLLGCGDDGTIAFKADYQSGGPTLGVNKAGQLEFAALLAEGRTQAEALAQLLASDVIWQICPGHAAEIHLVGGRRAIWNDRNKLAVLGLPQPQQIGNVWRPHAYEAGGRWWASYFSDQAGVVLHPFDSFEGYRIMPAGVDCWHDGRVLAPGSAALPSGGIFIGKSSSEAEQAGQITSIGFSLSEPTIDLKPEQPPQPPLNLPAPTRRLWGGCFEFAQAPKGPGNALLQVRNHAGALPRPAIIGAEEVGLASGQLLGLFIGGSSVEDIEAQAKASHLRPVAYWDNNRWPRWPALPAGSWLCIRAYWQLSQTLDAFIAEARQNLSSAPKGVPLILVPQQYSSNSDQHGYVDPRTPAPQDSTELRAIAPLFAQWANEFAQVHGLMLFSGFGRRGGLMDHPDLLEAWTRWSAQLQAPAIEAYPPKPEPPIPPKPEPPSLYVKHKEYRMSAKQNVLIIGTAGKAGRPDKPNSGPWGDLKDDAGKPRNWRGVLFDGVVDGNGNLTPAAKAQASDYSFELSQPDARHQLYHAGVDGFFGADATAFATKPGSDQFYIKPAAETRGGYESPVVYEGNLTPGLLSGQVEYVYNDGRGPAGVSCGFSVKVLS